MRDRTHMARLGANMPSRAVPRCLRSSELFQIAFKLEGCTGIRQVFFRILATKRVAMLPIETILCGSKAGPWGHLLAKVGPLGWFAMGVHPTRSLGVCFSRHLGSVNPPLAALELRPRVRAALGSMGGSRAVSAALSATRGLSGGKRREYWMTESAPLACGPLY